MWDRISENQGYARQQTAAEELLRFDKAERPSCLASKDNGGSVSLGQCCKMVHQEKIEVSRGRCPLVEELESVSRYGVIEPRPKRLPVEIPFHKNDPSRQHVRFFRGTGRELTLAPVRLRRFVFGYSTPASRSMQRR